MDQNSLEDLIAETVRGYRVSMRGADGPIGPDTALFGPDGVLDSIGLVSIVVELEQRLSDREGQEISLMNDRALSRTRSPFRTVRSLAEYAREQLSSGGSR
jgi:acyl carrier protein